MTLTNKQRRVLRFISDHGTGAAVNTNTARALHQRGLITEPRAAVMSSGSSARITEAGKRALKEDMEY